MVVCNGLGPHCHVRNRQVMKQNLGEVARMGASEGQLPMTT